MPSRAAVVRLLRELTETPCPRQTTSSAFRKPEFAVLRRFSHFLWLYDALTQNNPGVIVPGMPEKHAIGAPPPSLFPPRLAVQHSPEPVSAGRFGSEFVENRRLGLEAALNKIVSHPMLVGDPDLRLFLESDTFHIDVRLWCCFTQGARADAKSPFSSADQAAQDRYDG